MLYSLIYISTVLTLICFLAWFTVYVALLSYSFLKGAPYVPTQAAELDDIFSEAETLFKKYSKRAPETMLELGCGDGRVSLYAALHKNITATGVDINPYLIMQARILAWLSNTKKVTFHRQDIRDISFTSYDIIYIFLLPALTKQVQNKIREKAKPGVLVISHGFKIEDWDRFLKHTREGRKFKTYYYTLT